MEIHLSIKEAKPLGADIIRWLRNGEGVDVTIHQEPWKPEPPKNCGELREDCF